MRYQPRWVDALTQHLCKEKKTQRDVIKNTIWFACQHNQSYINISHVLRTSHLYMNNYLSHHCQVHPMILECLITGPLPRIGHRTPNRIRPHTQYPVTQKTICSLVLPPIELYALLSYNLPGQISLYSAIVRPIRLLLLVPKRTCANCYLKCQGYWFLMLWSPSEKCCRKPQPASFTTCYQ